MASGNSNEDAFSSSSELPLKLLRDIVLEDTYEWLEDEDEKQRGWLKIQRSLQAFQQQQAGTTTTATPPSSSSSEPPRICEFTTSQINPDGYGGIDKDPAAEGNLPDEEVSKEEEVADNDIPPKEPGSVTVKYILSDNWQGFGNQVWAAARHLANMMVDVDRCRLLLSTTDASSSSSTTAGESCHPLQGLWFCELGAGAAIPSWIALRMGARVVALDQAIAGRIRVVAECAARNWYEVQSSLTGEKEEGEDSKPTFHRPVVYPHDWGSPVDELFQFLGGENSKDGESSEAGLDHPRFDMVVATECLFMPWFYSDLLDSIESLLADNGVAILTSALHGNVPEEEVWNFLDLAKERGFEVDQPVPATQLTPQKSDMKVSQALVYTIRLSRRPKVES